MPLLSADYYFDLPLSLDYFLKCIKNSAEEYHDIDLLKWTY